jgi:uncharacterized integral membrane protein (TIGR00701 family)
MDYTWLKALHVAAVLTWVGGMLLLAVVIKVAAAISADARPAAFLDGVQRWNRFVTSPAMLLLWVLGLTLAMQGGWFSSPWLMAKLVLVVALSGLHGTLTGRLRKLAQGGENAPAALASYAAPAIVVSVVLIAILVIVKPF